MRLSYRISRSVISVQGKFLPAFPLGVQRMWVQTLPLPQCWVRGKLGEKLYFEVKFVVLLKASKI